jgi:hypothetical protein
MERLRYYYLVEFIGFLLAGLAMGTALGVAIAYFIFGKKPPTNT